MGNVLKIFGAGLLISWLGALPLGTLNITAFDIAASQGYQNAFLFAVSAVLVELFYVRLSLWGNKRWMVDEQWITALLLLGILVLGYLAISSFLEPTTSAKTVDGTPYLTRISSPILLGVLLSALNPLQFPFWFTWNKVLTNKKILHDNAKMYICYMLGIGLGTFLALTLFIGLGANLLSNYQEYTFYTNKILGTVYLGFAIYLLYVLYKRTLKPIIE